MNDNRIVVALQEQNDILSDILSDISKTHKKSKAFILRGILIFGFGFICGTINQILRKASQEKHIA